MILFVTYNQTGQATGNSEFFKALQAQGPWWHYINTTWLIDTQKTPQQVFDALRPMLGTNDRLLVGELGNRYQGWLPKDAWEWINARMKSRQESLL